MARGLSAAPRYTTRCFWHPRIWQRTRRPKSPDPAHRRRRQRQPDRLFRAIESAQRADTLVYSILFSDRDAYDGVFASADGKKALQRLSRETGGAILRFPTRSRSRPFTGSWRKSCATSTVSVTHRIEAKPERPPGQDIVRSIWPRSGADYWSKPAMVTTRSGKMGGRNPPALVILGQSIWREASCLQ